MEDILTPILDCLAKANVWYAVAALAVWYFFSGYIKTALSKIPGLRTPVDPLEDHALLDRIWQQVKGKFAGKDDPEFDDLYQKILKAIKDIQ